MSPVSQKRDRWKQNTQQLSQQSESLLQSGKLEKMGSERPEVLV